MSVPDLFDFPCPGPNATCPLLMLDENAGEPRNLRSPKWFSPPEGCTVDLRGFAELPISANAQCGDKGWREVVRRVRLHSNGLIINLSLRQESYAFVKVDAGDFKFPEDVEYAPDIGFMPVSWFTPDGNWAQVGLSDQEAQQWETLLVGTLARQKHVQLIFPNANPLPPVTFPILAACGPKEMAKSHGMKFRRLFITDHCGPRVDAIDKFLDLMREFKSAFFCVNCHGGDGRCTSAIVMMDIAHNAHQGVSFESILARNMLLYDYDLQKIPKKEFKRKYAINRLEVLKMFYRFCSETNPLSHENSFQNWLAEKGIIPH